MSTSSEGNEKTMIGLYLTNEMITSNQAFVKLATVRIQLYCVHLNSLL